MLTEQNVAATFFPQQIHTWVFVSLGKHGHKYLWRKPANAPIELASTAEVRHYQKASTVQFDVPRAKAPQLGSKFSGITSENNSYGSSFDCG